MLSLFSTNSATAGFRLEYMEVYNWGTFNGSIVRINPQGNNSLLTGANGSGKSTYIDALLTLMVPKKKDRFYNQSSGVEKKGDRTEETYVLGNYGNIQEEGKSGTTAQKLRNHSDYSVLLAHFKNTDLNQVTLFQVRWFSNSVLRAKFGIAYIPLEISKDFNPFDVKGDWIKRLDKRYNEGASKKKIEFFDSISHYEDQMCRTFGMRSNKALSLFNQIVGVKVLDDLDQFIRINMLESCDAENAYKNLKDVFVMLMDAKTNIEKAKEQIKQLTPICEIAKTLENIKEKLKHLQKSKEMGVFWFAKKGVELGEKEMEKCKENLQKLKDELANLEEKEKKLRNEETDLRVQIKSDLVGKRIDDLKQEIDQLQKSKDLSSKKLEEYNEFAQRIKFSTNPNEATFNENREKSKDLEKSTNKIIDIENKEFRKLENEKDELVKLTNELTSTIQILHKNKNNIAGRTAEIREEILAHIGASREEIPFVGELIKVKDSEKHWETSIEKALHNFALWLIVPKKYYSQVNDYVNNTNLKGKIVYYKYEENPLSHFIEKKYDEKSLINKVEIKDKKPYYEWIEEKLNHQFNFICVDDLNEFEDYSEMAITKEGLIKFKKGRHEKDDRKHTISKENFVLGWDNTGKINNLKEELIKLQKQQIENEKAIKQKNNEIRELKKLEKNYYEFFLKFEKFEDINWEFYTKEINEKEKQISNLEKTNNRVRELQKQLDKVEVKLKNLSKEKDTNSRNMYEIGRDQKEIEKFIRTHQEDMALNPSDVSEFEIQNSDLSSVNYTNFENKLTEFQNNNSEKKEELENQKCKNEDEVKIKINAFKQPTEEITSKFRDWRSDVNSLPDSIHLELISEYQIFLNKLEEDSLPKYENKFNKFLQDVILGKVGEFRRFFDKWKENIEENIEKINESLKNIDYNEDGKTYIQLVLTNKITNEVKDFRRMLNEAYPSIAEIGNDINKRKVHFCQYIEPLMKKMESEDWRKRVMDVRSWFTYKAEEFYRETNQKFKTYEAMGQLSGGQKAQLTYTILGSAIAYQFGLTKDGLEGKSFRFIAIDEAFKAQDEDRARYLISLCKQLHLQLLVVTPSDKIHIVENDISYIHYVECKDQKESILWDMPIQQFQEEKSKYLAQ
ncbi:MAG: SbcC/MukB-like Walker B domain-containing protein [Bacteroidota bacterium]|nr:SbcC/MukB-like Walker B domain-containing protein [Bacteroidota bacterium]